MRTPNARTLRASRLAPVLILLLAACGGGASPGALSVPPPAAVPGGSPLVHPSLRLAMVAETLGDLVFVAGGFEEGATGSATVGTLEAFDPATGTWTRRAPMPTPRSFAASAVIQGRFFVFGGLDADGRATAAVEAYDPVDDRWYACAPLPAPRSRLAAVADTRYLGPAVGAWVGGGMDAAVKNAAGTWYYAQDRWMPEVTLPSPRHGHALAMTGMDFLALGGYDDAGALARCDRFEESMEARRWIAAPPLGTARGFFGAARIGNLLHVVGGRTREIPPTEVLDLDDPAAGWRTAAPLPVDLCRFSMVAWNGRLLVFGGETDFGASVNRSIYEYDPKTDAWTTR